MTQNKSNRRKRNVDFLQGYNLGKFLLSPNPKTGRAGISEGLSAVGDEVIVREWRRKAGDEDLVAIWKHELRQLYRLGGYPGAEKYICRVISAGFDDTGYYIVLDAAQKRPLHVFLEGSSVRASWLRGVTQPQNRKRVWENISHVVSGLGILHREGMVHRNLDEWAILTSAGSDPDFQLTGFEWSLRLSGTEDKARGSSKNADTVSFAKDWADLAILIANIFNLNLKKLRDPKVADHRVHDAIPSAEIRLLRDLLAPSLFDNFNSNIVEQGIQVVLTDLGVASDAVEANWALVFSLSQSSPLSRAVREASGNEVEMSDRDAQLRWINDDLSPTSNLISTSRNDITKYWLEGRELAYEIKPFEATGRTPNWRMAFAIGGISKAKLRKDNEASIPLTFTSIRSLMVAYAHKNYNRIITKSPDWSKLFAGLENRTERYTSSSERLLTAFHLLHAIDVALTTSNIFPVVIVSENDHEQQLKLQYRPNKDIEDLATALGLDLPEKRFEEVLSKDGFEGSGTWFLTEAVNIGRAAQNGVELEFLSQSDLKGEDGQYDFINTSTIFFPKNTCYLQHSSLRGSASQLRRRSKALEYLSEHTELIENLSDPRGRLSDTHEVVNSYDAFSNIDEAKQAALREISAILPMYLLQGPPGVGKTYLLMEIVKRRFQHDQTSRLLVTSQGNHAVDHLVSEMADMWKQGDGEGPLTVRCRARESNSIKSPYDIDIVSRELISTIAKSEMTQSSSLDLKNRISDCVNDEQNMTGEINALESLILRSANVVLATTNSQSVATLLDAHAQFDWTIVEEAAKATGGELIAPLMLSHRRLLIGDHKQLPPYGSREIQKILSSPAKLKEAIKSLPLMLDRSVLHLLDDDIEGRFGETIEDMEDICSRTSQVLFMFESILTEELDRQKKNPEIKKIGGALSVQHRMHDAICRIVSHTFYGDKLVTSKSKKDEASSKANWINSIDKNLLPVAPFVSINMPYERTTIGSGRFEELPRFSNPSEATQVIKAIERLQVTDDGGQAPSLVILSPYMEQVKLIKSELANSPRANLALKKFRAVTQSDDWVATVDSFQGNEADVVIFSLVRNNRSAWITSALGFVSDQRRFNVLLSRARERFIFIGSREFLKEISSPMGRSAPPEAEFIRRFLNITEELAEEGLHKFRNISLEEIRQ